MRKEVMRKRRGRGRERYDDGIRYIEVMLLVMMTGGSWSCPFSSMVSRHHHGIRSQKHQQQRYPKYRRPKTKDRRGSRPQEKEEKPLLCSHQIDQRERPPSKRHRCDERKGSVGISCGGSSDINRRRGYRYRAYDGQSSGLFARGSSLPSDFCRGYADEREDTGTRESSKGTATHPTSTYHQVYFYPRRFTTRGLYNRCK